MYESGIALNEAKKQWSNWNTQSVTHRKHPRRSCGVNFITRLIANISASHKNYFMTGKTKKESKEVEKEILGMLAEKYLKNKENEHK